MDLAGRFGGRRAERDLAYAAVLALGALDAAGYSVIAPVLPAIGREIHAGPALIGVLVASFPAAMIAGFAAAGTLVRRGQLAVLLRVSLLLTTAGALGFVLGSGFAVYMAARAVMGLGSGGLWIAVTFSTLQRWPGEEYLCMSRVFAAYSVGGLIGPALGAIGGIRGPFAAYVFLAVCGLLVQRPLVRLLHQRRYEPDRAALRLRGFWVASAGILFAVMGLGIVEGVLPLHLASRLSQGEIGGVYVGMSLIVSASAAAAGVLRPRPTLLVSTVLVVAGLGVAGATADVPIWLLALVLAGAGIGFANTGSLGILIQTVDAERIVTAMVVWSQLGIVGYLLGPLAGGGITQALGFAALGLVPLAAAAAVLLLASPQLRRAHV